MHAALAYYYAHRSEVDAREAADSATAETIRSDIDRKHDATGTRARLQAVLDARKTIAA